MQHRLTEIIKNEFIPHMVEIANLVDYAKNEDKVSIDFNKVSKFISKRKEEMIGQIAVYCGNVEARQNLKEFDTAKGNEFAAYKFIDKFGYI